MYLLRKVVDNTYDAFRDLIFRLTTEDPEKAHERFIELSDWASHLKIDKLLFDNGSNYKQNKFDISNAAGFNKNGNIPPQFLRYLGFNRNVIGTVTADPWLGNNDRPRIWRYPKTNSMVNFLGLPGIGAKRVAENYSMYINHGVPTTVSIMSTPGKKRKDELEDIALTVRIMRSLYKVDRFELNISCPNTECGVSREGRQTYRSKLNDMLSAVEEIAFPHQEIYLKISPDLTEEYVDDSLEVIQNHNVKGIVATNTTRDHDKKYINPSPGKGGASGTAVYDKAKKIQDMFDVKSSRKMKIVAVGGIDSAEKARERTSSEKVKEMQIYTGLIFRGPKLLEELRRAA